jgi:hypothetical protein
MKRRLLILGKPIAVGSPWAALAQATGTPAAARPSAWSCRTRRVFRSARQRGSLRAAWPIT